MPISRKAADVCDELFDVIARKNSKHTLQVILADGTNVNTGHQSGVIMRLERKLDRPLQWGICLLHANELPLKALFREIDGRTLGPEKFEGPIGQSIAANQRVNELPVVAFQPIPEGKVEQIMDEDIVKGFNSDQIYFYKISITGMKTDI